MSRIVATRLACGEDERPAPTPTRAAPTFTVSPPRAYESPAALSRVPATHLSLPFRGRGSSEDPWTPFMIAEELSPLLRYWIATDGSATSSATAVPRSAVTRRRHDDYAALTRGVQRRDRLSLSRSWPGPTRPGHREIFLDVRPTRVPSRFTSRVDSSRSGAGHVLYFRNPVEEAVEMRAS